MSEAKPETSTFGESQLAKVMPKELVQEMKAHMKFRMSTNQRLMEVKRRNIAALTLTVERLINSMDVDEQGNKLSINSEEYMKKLNTTNLLGNLATMQCLEYICDSLSWQEQATIKGSGKKVIMRQTVADSISQLVSIISDTEPSDEENLPDGIAENLEMLCNMMNEIGIAQKAFKDKNGVVDAYKYFAPIKEKKEKEDREVNEGEGLEEEEAEKIENQDLEAIKSKLGKKNKDTTQE